MRFPASVLRVLSMGNIIHLHFLTLPRCKWVQVLLVSNDRLTSFPGDGKSHLSAKRHRNWKLVPTSWALWLEKDKLLITVKKKKYFDICYLVCE